MGPLEKRLLSEFAVYLIKNCARAAGDVSIGIPHALDDRRRWFAQRYREWQLTPRVELAGRSPYEAINAERAAYGDEVARILPRPSIELYTDLPTLLPPDTPEGTPRAAASQSGGDDRDGTAAPGTIDPVEATRWRQLADRLFGSWLDERLDRL